MAVAITSRQINLVIRASAFALCAIAILSLSVALLAPLQIDTGRNGHARAKSPTAAPGAPAALAPLESFATIWANPLRRALNEPTADPQSPEAIAAQATAAASAPPPITLVGTVGESLAMLRGPDGTVSVLAVGDQLAGVQVLAIRPAQIDVRYNSRSLTLDKPKEGGTGILIHGPSEDRVQAQNPDELINQR